MDSKEIVGLRKVIQEKINNTAGIIIIKNDKTAYEDYFNGYDQESSLHVASVTKSIISILIGIAVDQGLIKSIDQKVLDYFPEYQMKRGEKRLQEVTIKNLMTMTAPYKYKYEPYTKVYSSDDWTKAVLDLLGGKNEIGNFKYTTVGIQVLSGILTNATAMPVLEFANEYFFDPMGIKSPHNIRINNKEEHFSFLKDSHVPAWVVDPKGVNTAGWGLCLKTRDMAKIGQLFLNNGTWEGNRIISSKWVEESTSLHSQHGDISYGYLWWIIDIIEPKTYAAIGDGGNVIYVSSKKKLVVAIASRFMPRAKDRIEFIRNHIESLY